MAHPIRPDEFDPEYYRSTNPDLGLLGDDELYHHYESIGRAEGRPAAAAAFREVLVQIAGQLESILEIGPFTDRHLPDRMCATLMSWITTDSVNAPVNITFL